MKNEIRHLGVVDTVDVGLIKVRITQTSACSSCKMSGNCNASESKEKVVDVYCDNHYGLKLVTMLLLLHLSVRAFLAVLLSSVIPLIILVAVLAMLFVVTQSEIFSGVVQFMFAHTLLCYFILYERENTS